MGGGQGAVGSQAKEVQEVKAGCWWRDAEERQGEGPGRMGQEGVERAKTREIAEDKRQGGAENPSHFHFQLQSCSSV